MSTGLGEWPSNAENDRHFASEGITQQPGPFYNGNFSSSIWGTPPTPPLWRDTPQSSYGSSYNAHKQASGLSSFDRHKKEPVTPCKIQPSREQGESVSNWTGIFSSGLPVRKQDVASSPFTFGFPAPTSVPTFSHACNESMQSGPSFLRSNFPAKHADVSEHKRTIIGNSMMSDKKDNECFTKESTSSLEELSKSWAAMLQAQAELFGSLDGSFNYTLAGGQALSSEGQQPSQHVHCNNVADAETHKISVNDDQSAQQSGAGPELVQSKTERSVFDKKDDLGTFVFGSSFASGMNLNAGFSQQKDFSSPALGSKTTSSLASTKGRRHNNVTKRRSAAAPMSRESQPRPSKCNMDSSCSSSLFLKFTMGVSDANGSECPKPCSKDRNTAALDRDPDLCQTPSFLPGIARFISQDRGSRATFNAKNQGSESQHAQAFDKQFSAWHPFPSKEENLLKNCVFDGAASTEGTSCLQNFDEKLERRETSVRAPFLEQLPKTSIETHPTLEEPKLTEFDLNSPCKLSAEDLRERAGRGGKLGEEIKRQKENQEPNFSFGNQKGSRPFIFGSSRTTCNIKHSVSNFGDINKNKRSSRGTKGNKVLEHFVAKLGERMANLGKSHDNLGDQEIVFEGSKKCSASESSSSRFCKYEEEKGKATCKSEDAANEFEKNETLDRSIDEIREQLTKLGNLDAEDKVLKGKTDAVGCFSNGTTDDIALEHAVRELREQISKLGRFDNKGQEDMSKFSASEAQYRGSKDSSPILHAVEELTKRIAKLNNAVRDKNENECLSSGLQHRDTFTQSVEELQERMKTLGKVNEKELDHTTESKVEDNKKVVQEAFVFTACGTPTQKDSDSSYSHCSKAFVNNNQNGRAQFNPFTNVSYTNMFSSNQAQSSRFCPMENPFTAGQPLANPFSMANPFTAGQPSVTNPFTARQPFSFPEVYSGTNIFSFDRPSANSSANAGLSAGGFVFQGTKGPLQGTAMQRKSGRACPDLRTREKGKSARSSRSAQFTSKSHCPGSPMDFSPCVDKAAPSSPVVVPSGEAEQESVLTSSVPKSEEVESMNVEEIRIATSKLTFGNDRGSCKGSREGSGYAEHASDQTNPFVLRQKKGTWKRAPRKGTAVFASSTEDVSTKLQSMNEPRMGYGGSCGMDRATSSLFSPLVYAKGVSSMEGPQKYTTWNSSSGYFSGEKLEKSTEKAATVKTSLPLKLGEMDKDQKASSIAGDTPSSSLSTKSAAAEQMCENWKLRGNQAYAKGDYEKAEDCYTRGVSSVFAGHTSESCLRASMLCYSNRAATRMAVGRMREALADCKQAIMLDSSFLRVRLRAASCHLALGESQAAATLFTECWRLAKDESSFDLKVLEEAMDGIRKCQNFDNLLEKASKLLQKETSTEAIAALQLLKEALTVSPFSEATQNLKAQALFLLRRFEDVVQLCQKTLPAAEENHGAHHHDESRQIHSAYLNLWRWRMGGKALFQLGRLDESLSLLTKYEEASCGLPSDEAADRESMTSTIGLIHDLLRHKAAGNEAFQAGRHAEALEHYTAALSCNSESRPYNAVCFCNRAAASQALGHIADAIADCSRAIVLDSSYAKAISRRATLHEVIKDFGQTCSDLQRLITLLERQESLSKSPKMTRTASKSAHDLRQARERLDKATREMKKDCAVDHYLILGLDVSCSASDIKKAYRKEALKHHPDKAGQFLVRGENGDDGSLWKEVSDEVRRDAERLFKIIGESYAILSDPVKRAQYDLEYQISKARNSTYPGYCDTEDHSFPSERSGPQRYERKDGWSGRSPRYQRWQNGPDAAQPDTYSERGTRHSSKAKERRYRGRPEYYWEEV